MKSTILYHTLLSSGFENYFFFITTTIRCVVVFYSVFLKLLHLQCDDLSLETRNHEIPGTFIENSQS